MNTGAHKSQNIIDKMQRFDDASGMPLGDINTFHILNTPARPQEGAGDMNAAQTKKTYGEGLADGRSQALDEQNMQSAVIRDAAQGIQDEVQKITHEIEASHARVISKILQPLLRGIADQHTITAVRDFISQMTAPAMQGCVTLHVNSGAQKTGQANLFDTLTDILQEIGATHSVNKPEFKLEKSQNIAGDGGREIWAKWQGGGASLDLKSVTEQCLALIGNTIKNTEESNKGAANGQV